MSFKANDDDDVIIVPVPDADYFDALFMEWSRLVDTGELGCKCTGCGKEVCIAEYDRHPCNATLEESGH